MDAFFAQLNINPNLIFWIGALLALIGIIMIVKKGISLIFWALLLVLGISGFNYGLKSGGVDLSPDLRDTLSAMVEPGKAVSKEAMKSLCLRLAEEERGSAAWCQQQRSRPKADWSSNDAMLYAQQCVIPPR